VLTVRSLGSHHINDGRALAKMRHRGIFLAFKLLAAQASHRPVRQVSPDRPESVSAPVRFQFFLQEILDGIEELHPILLHDDGMRAFAVHDETLGGRVDE
jgi:hypothetical protein